MKAALAVGVVAGVVTAGQAVSSYAYLTVNATLDTNVTVPRQGTLDVKIPIFLSARSSHSVTARYASKDGTATANDDYLPVKGEVTFAPGVTRQFIHVTVIGTDLFEFTEYFEVDLTGSQGAFIGVPDANVDLFSPVPFPTLTIRDASTVRPPTGTGTCLIPIGLLHPSGESTRVDFSTKNGSAKRGVDYEPKSGSLILPPGTKVKKIGVDIIGSPDPGPDITFKVVLTNIQNAQAKRTTGVCTISQPGG
jgi:hypothetical protein